MEIIYQEVKLSTMLSLYTDGFVLKDGSRLFQFETCVDVNKDKVIFKLIIENKDEAGGSDLNVD